MRKSRWLVLALCALCVVLALPVLHGLADGETTEKDPKKVYVLNKNASLWPKEEAKGEAIVKSVGIDYAVTVLKRDGEWTRVALLDGREGYMRTYYLGGLYKIAINQRAYIMREKQKEKDRYATVAFDRSSGEQLIVLWEEEDWLYVIELKDGLGGYLSKDVDYTIIEYP